eukprot:12415627-Karenia_brevis.AAC.1
MVVRITHLSPQSLRLGRTSLQIVDDDADAGEDFAENDDDYDDGVYPLALAHVVPLAVASCCPSMEKSKVR